jgi:iron(III) transport system substrate-binding protein
LFIPNTVAILKNAPHREEAERLASYLLSLEVENSLATGPSAQVPLNRRSDVAVQVETPKTVHAMNVDFEHAAQIWDQVADFLTREFSTP